MAMYFFLQNKTTKPVTLKALGLTIQPNEIRAIKRETFLKVHIKLRNEGVLPKIKFVSKRDYLQYSQSKKPLEKETAPQPTEEVASQPVEETTEQPVEETAEQPVEETTEQPVEKTTEQTTKKRKSSRKKQKKEDEK